MKPNAPPNYENGRAIPTAAMIRPVAITGTLALLSKNGTLAVRMMWMISVWVSKLSTGLSIR